MNIESLANDFDKERNIFSYKDDSLESNKTVMLPGRFYILQYIPKTDNKNIAVNTRPVILSMGFSNKDNESFLCIDLCVIPRNMRLKFVQIFFDMFKNEISDNIKKHPFVDNADEQTEILEFNYKNLSKIDKFFPIMNAVKRYKIKNTRKIYSLPFVYVYKAIGNFADENWFINGNIGDVQKEFLKKCMKKK